MDLTKHLKVVPLVKTDDYKILKKSSVFNHKIEACFVSMNGQNHQNGFLVSSFHGRSIVTNYSDGYYRILKGVGFTLYDKTIINLCEYFDNHIWGVLSKKDAIQEYDFGHLAYSKGVYCPIYESVYSLSKNNYSGVGIKRIQPVILQYRVHSPVRISDAAFFEKSILINHIEQLYNTNESIQKQFIDRCVNNLSSLHNNYLFYNSLNIFNVCLSGEFLDFENSLSDSHSDFSEMQKYMPRELINLMFVIHAFASVINEDFNIKYFKSRIKSHYLDTIKNPLIKKQRKRILDLIK